MDYLVQIGSNGPFLLVLAVFIVLLHSFQVSFWILILLHTWAVDGVGNHDESWYSCLFAIGTPPMNEPPSVKPGNRVSNSNIYLYRINVRREA